MIDEFEREKNWKRKKPKRKKFALQRRYIGSLKSSGRDFMAGCREWSTWARYETAEARDAALACLSGKADDKPDFWKWEYRAGDDS